MKRQKNLIAAAINKKALKAAMADPEKRKVLEAIFKKVRY